MHALIHSTAQCLGAQLRAGVLALALTSCVIMGKLLDISPAPHLSNWGKSTHITDGCATP